MTYIDDYNPRARSDAETASDIGKYNKHLRDLLKPRLDTVERRDGGRGCGALGK